VAGIRPCNRDARDRQLMRALDLVFVLAPYRNAVFG
jgi:hypothetical protein